MWHSTVFQPKVRVQYLRPRLPQNYASIDNFRKIITQGVLQRRMENDQNSDQSRNWRTMNPITYESVYVCIAKPPSTDTLTVGPIFVSVTAVLLFYGTHAAVTQISHIFISCLWGPEALWYEPPKVPLYICKTTGRSKILRHTQFLLYDGEDDGGVSFSFFRRWESGNKHYG